MSLTFASPSFSSGFALLILKFLELNLACSRLCLHLNGAQEGKSPKGKNGGWGK